MNINRGDIFLASLDPVIGHEISKTRPVVIISNNINNKYSSTVSILPLTSKIKADQVRTLDKVRLIKKFGTLSEEQIVKLNQSIKVHLALD